MGIPGKYGTLVVLLSLLLVAGCIGEDRDDCKEQGYNLLFYYSGDGDTDIFPAKIDRVILFAYDQDDNRVWSEELSRSRLEQYQGTTLDLPDGYYTVVCWGNADGYTTLSGQERIATGRLYQSEWSEGETATGFDPLYYGSKTVYIETEVEKTDRLDFVSAHINMEVHITGLRGLTGSPDTEQVALAVEQSFVGYDFYRDLRPETTSLYPVGSSRTEAGIEVLDFYFNLLRFEQDTDIVLRVVDAGGETAALISLSEFLASNDIRVEGVNEITVPVYILFRGTGYYVTVDGWATVPVDPIGG